MAIRINTERQVLQEGINFNEEQPQSEPDIDGAVRIFNDRNKGGRFEQLLTDKFYYNLDQITFNFKNATDWHIYLVKEVTFGTGDSATEEEVKFELSNKSDFGSNKGFLEPDLTLAPVGDFITVSTTGVDNTDKIWMELTAFTISVNK